MSRDMTRRMRSLRSKGDDGWDVRLSQSCEGFQAALATYEVVGLHHPSG